MENEWVSVEESLPEGVGVRSVFIMSTKLYPCRALYAGAVKKFLDKNDNEIKGVTMWCYDKIPYPPQSKEQ